MKRFATFVSPSLLATAVVLTLLPAPAGAQTGVQPSSGGADNMPAAAVETGGDSSSSAAGASLSGISSSALAAPSAPEPSADRGDKRGGVPWEGTAHYGPLSRMSVGADVSPLGIGIKSSVILTEKIDARVLGNFFSYDTGKFELEGFRVDANLHMASMGASVDVYPMNSIWRLSGGLMFYNGNQVSAVLDVVPGTSFKLNGTTYYSATANPATGATPLTGTGVVGFHTRQPGFMASGGFGKFIPRSNRHWSFPTEFGVLFMGSPTVNVNTAGWVCTDKAQTQCSNISDMSNPVGQAFNSNLQTQLTKWRKSLSPVTLYPIFSYSVVYSFNLP